MRGTTVGVMLALAALGAHVSAAEATYPGTNGQIAFSARIGPDTSNEIHTLNPDGGGLTRLTDAPGDDADPNWSRDGTRIAFSSRRDHPGPPADCENTICDTGIYVMDADGSDETLLVDAPGVEESDPAWSPDGSQVAYSVEEPGPLPEPSTGFHLWVVNADGSNPHRLYPNDDRLALDPTWRPQGGWIAYTELSFGHFGVVRSLDGSTRFSVGGEELNWSPYNDWIVSVTIRPEGNEIARRAATGSDFAEVLSGIDLRSPVWSPDGEKIAYTRVDEIHVVPANGFSSVLLLAADGPVDGIDWQAVPTVIPGHPRPKGATPLRASLVPAYRQCDSPNRTHGPPLAFGSCSSPQPAAGAATVGTPDANGQPARFEGSVTVEAIPGNPGTLTDEADVFVRVRMRDVRRAGDLGDYTGGLRIPLEVRQTDHFNGCCEIGGPHSGTLIDGFIDDAFVFGAGCLATPDPAEGAACSSSTSADAITPGLVREGQRAIWELGPIRVYDSADRLFATQGVFVP